jgi:hypothetical protein
MGGRRGKALFVSASVTPLSVPLRRVMRERKQRTGQRRPRRGDGELRRAGERGAAHLQMDWTIPIRSIHQSQRLVSTARAAVYWKRRLNHHGNLNFLSKN